MARRNNTQSSLGTIVAIIVFFASITMAAYIPLRRAKSGAMFVGIAGIIGGLGSLVWWFLTFENPPDDLKILASLSGGAYGLAVVLRLAQGPKDEAGVTATISTDDLPLRRNEVVLYQGVARFLGDRRTPVHLGVSFPLFGRVRGGVGTTVALTNLDVVDEGTLVVTNERVLIAGQGRTRTLKGRRLISTSVENGRVIIRPDHGPVVVASVDDAHAVEQAVRSLIELAT